MVVFLYFIDYKTQGDFTLCLIRNITGHSCPGCGVLRGISAILHLDFRAAYALNHLNLVIVPLLGYLFARAWVANRLG